MKSRENLVVATVGVAAVVVVPAAASIHAAVGAGDTWEKSGADLLYLIFPQTAFAIFFGHLILAVVFSHAFRARIDDALSAKLVSSLKFFMWGGLVAGVIAFVSWLIDPAFEEVVTFAAAAGAFAGSRCALALHRRAVSGAKRSP